MDPSVTGFQNVIPFFGNEGIVALGDVNGDGVADVVTATLDPSFQNTLQVSVTIANNTTTIPESVIEQLTFPVGGALVICDFDGDGVDDIITAPSFKMYSGKTGTLSHIQLAIVLQSRRQTGLRGSEWRWVRRSHRRPPGVAKPEHWHCGPWFVQRDIGSGPPAPSGFFTSVSVSFGAHDDIAAGDLDGDGFAEFVVASSLTGSIPHGVVNIFSAPGKTPPPPPLNSFTNDARLAIPRRTNPAPQSTTIQGFVPFQIQNIFYNPPGGASVQQFGTNYSVSSSTTWQTVDKNGFVVMGSVTFGIPLSAAMPTKSLQVGGMVTYQWETISGGGVSSSRTDSTTVNLNAHADIPSGLFDQFCLSIAIPATITISPDPNVPDKAVLDYANSDTVVLSGQQLVAIAQAASNVDELLNSEPAVPSNLIPIVKGQISQANARTILAADPSFVVASNGSITLRTSSQLTQVLQASPNRFFVEPINLENIPIPGATGPNTIPVPAGPPPGDQNQSESFTQALSNSQSSSMITGDGGDLQVQVTVSYQAQLFPGVTGMIQAGYAYEEEKQTITTTTTGTGKQDQITSLMSSPCVRGLMDIYYDSAYGTYLYVSHDNQLIPETTSNAVWFTKLCNGNVASPFGTACSANSDCASQVCTNGACAPPSCAQGDGGTQNCQVGQPCGLGGPFGDCSSQSCNLGICTAVLFASSCSSNSDCVTGSCVNGACAAPSCSPHCSPGAGCGVNGDCNSQVCFDGICVQPSCSPTCAEGTACGVNGDCASGVCTNGVCGPPACSPHCPQGNFCASNGECGSQVCANGTCQPPACAPNCNFGAGCGANSDCVSQVCSNGSCQAPVCAPTCSETAVCDQNTDCAAKICTNHKCAPPACSPTCNDGTACGANTECGSKVCTSAVCAPPACAPHCSVGGACGASGDCGTHVCTGGLCRACSPKCDQGAVCSGNGDCESQVCVGGVCKPPSCAPHCNQGTVCGANTDCGSQVCTNGLCAPPACSPHCAAGVICGVNADCLSLVCTGNVCHAPSCSPRCSANAACGVNGDCLSRVCTNGVCKAPACSPTCARGANCDSNTECTSHVCTNGLCQ